MERCEVAVTSRQLWALPENKGPSSQMDAFFLAKLQAISAPNRRQAKQLRQRTPAGPLLPRAGASASASAWRLGASRRRLGALARPRQRVEPLVRLEGSGQLCAGLRRGFLTVGARGLRTRWKTGRIVSHRPPTY